MMFRLDILSELRKLPKDCSSTYEWTLMLPAEIFQALAELSDDILFDIQLGCMGAAPPPTAVVIVERPESPGEPGSGFMWCYWETDERPKIR